MEKFTATAALSTSCAALISSIIIIRKWISSNRVSDTVLLWKVLLVVNGVLLVFVFQASYYIFLEQADYGIHISVALLVISFAMFISVKAGVDSGNELKRNLVSKEEKEVLLKELHHRVKNNLQVIISILKLQRLKPIDKTSERLIADCESRIFSMALIHENLYRSADLSSIDFSNYIKHLLNEIVYVNGGKEAEKIKVNINCCETHFPLDKLVPIGLIMNELVANTLRHAFNEKQSGLIEVEGKKEGNVFMIRYSDNGVGFDESALETKDSSLGLELVRTLIEQVDGEMQIINNNGTTFFIDVPIN